MTPPAITPGEPDPTLDDPMLRVLRERHPEVDVVVLPQSAPAPVAPVLAAERLDAVGAEVEQLLDEVLGRVADGDREVAREGRWHTDEWDQSWYEAVAVVGDLDRGDNVALLRSTGTALLGLGWQARPVPGDRPRLAARRRGGFEATATVRPTSLVVKVRTALVRVAAEVAG